MVLRHPGRQFHSPGITAMKIFLKENGNKILLPRQTHFSISLEGRIAGSHQDYGSLYERQDLLQAVSKGKAIQQIEFLLDRFRRILMALGDRSRVD